jgi:hypothetical protein
VRALSVRQPWAELIALGIKTIEVRCWSTKYRGSLLICSGGAWYTKGVKLHGKLGIRGACVCVVDLIDCRPLRRSDSEAAQFNVEKEPGFAWILERPRRVNPTPMKGRLMLFNPEITPVFV